MSQMEPDLLIAQFRQALMDCQRLYTSSGQLCGDHHADLLPKSPEEFIELMDDLHRGLVVKVYISVAQADRKWSRQEQQMAECLQAFAGEQD